MHWGGGQVITCRRTWEAGVFSCKGRAGKGSWGRATETSHLWWQLRSQMSGGEPGAAAGQKHCPSGGRAGHKAEESKDFLVVTDPSKLCSMFTHNHLLLLHVCLPKFMPILSLGLCREADSGQCSILIGSAYLNPA